MNWDDIRFFLALCREGAVSRAGRSLGVNHTTVARRIGAFEKQLGTRLFDKTRDGYAMTQAAENLLAKALEMEERALAIDRAVAGQDAQLEGLLRLTAPYDFANRIIVPELPAFRRRYPGIELELLTTKGLVDLSAREADIALRLTDAPPDYLVGREVLPLRHGVYGSPDYLATMGDEPDIILFRREKQPPEWVVQNFRATGRVTRTDDLTTMLACVRAGLGLARMPCFEPDSDPGVRRVDADLTPSTWGIWVLSHADLRSTARVRVCREFLTGLVLKRRALILGEQSRYR